MSGQVIHKVSREEPHKCELPESNNGGRYGAAHAPNDIFPGDIWLCSCGRRYRCFEVGGMSGTLTWTRLRRPMWMTKCNQLQKEADES